MIVLLSPAKTLDFESALPPLPATRAHFVEEAHSLARSAARLSQKRLSELMHISPRLAKLNAERFRDFPEQPERQALFAFAGDVYAGFEAQTLDEAGIAFAQDHVRMLSGLYGLLRPLDAIRPYRLEMGTRWAPRHRKLTDWWGGRIAELAAHAGGGGRIRRGAEPGQPGIFRGGGRKAGGHPGHRCRFSRARSRRASFRQFQCEAGSGHDGALDVRASYRRRRCDAGFRQRRLSLRSRGKHA